MAGTMIRGVAAVLALTAAGLSAGCAVSTEPIPSSEAVTQATELIKGGYADTTDTAVVGIAHQSSGGMGMCTGTLIAPNLVLTARHCVAPIKNEVNGGVDCSSTYFGANYAASSFYITADAAFSYQGTFHGASQIITPTESTKVCGYDVALIILSDSIPASVATPMIPRVDSPLSANLPYHAIGYGETDDGNGQSGQRRRLDGLAINCVGADCPNYYGSMLHEFLGETGICSGDSGGPAVDAEERVIGVTSRGGAGCVSPIYGDVYAWGDWIKAGAVEAASKGGYAAADWVTGGHTDPVYTKPIGQECAAPTDCDTNVCVSDGVGIYCTRPCDEVGACPDGYTCDDTNTKTCLKVYEPVDPGGAGGSDGAGGGGVGAAGGGGSSETGTPTTKATKVTEFQAGCSVGRANTDPTKPIPWLTGFALAGALAIGRRRRR